MKKTSRLFRRYLHTRRASGRAALSMVFLPNDRLTIYFNRGLGHCITGPAEALAETWHWNDYLHNML